MSLVEFRFLAETGHSQTELQISAVDPQRSLMLTLREWLQPANS